MSKLFALIHDPAGDCGVSYDGMNQQTVMALLVEKGFQFDFIDAPTYAAFIQAHQPVQLTPAQLLASFRSQAIDSLLTDPTGNSKFVRAILLTILDEINVIRALLPGPPAARTILQLKNAVQSKINTGAAD